MNLPMPMALLMAVAGSLVLHVAALFGPDVALFHPENPPPLRAELVSLPPVPAGPAGVPPATPPPARKTPPAPPRAQKHRAAPPSAVDPAGRPISGRELLSAAGDSRPDAAAAETSTSGHEALPAAQPSEPAAVQPESGIGPQPAPPAPPRLPATGVIRYAIIKESLGLQIGRAEQRWDFDAEGRYRLTGMTETSGLAALFKPVRVEVESRGALGAGGLRPEQFRTRRNGRDTLENADFDWSTASVHLARDDSTQPVAPGTQDLLSLYFQLAFLGELAEGRRIGVVTGKKYERYDLDALGEEMLETPAGQFRTLHLRAMTDNVTEIWVALDRLRLPVKIRFTDRKGASFAQVVTEIGSHIGSE